MSKGTFYITTPIYYPSVKDQSLGLFKEWVTF